MMGKTERIRTSCPRDCYDGCGIVVERRGKELRVLGDPDHPVSRGRLCGKCAVAYNGIWQDDSARLAYPMRRSGPKGAGKFTRIGWEEALTETAAQLSAAVRGHGPESVLHTHYSGTLSLLAVAFPMRFFHRLGAAEVDPDTICNAAGHAAWRLMFGESAIGFDPRTVGDSRYILIWGANPSHSGPHVHKHWFAASAAKKIVIDPVRTDTAAAADLHLQPRPGTDAALAFGILHVLKRERRFDQPFVDRHTRGAEAVQDDIDRCTPEWTERCTGVPADLLREAARCYGQGPSLLWAGQALQRQRRGGNIMRAVGLLPAMTGNVGKPGAGFYYLNDTAGMAGLDSAWLEAGHLATGPRVRVSHMDFAAELARPDRFQALCCWNTNPAASAPRQRALHAALAREDLFTVVVDCFQTDTADYADILLPAAGFLEFDDLTAGYFHLIAGAQAKVREPPGEALPNQEIFRGLARAMDYPDPELYEPDQSLISTALAQMGFDGDFEMLKQQGWWPIRPDVLQPWHPLEFPTPSGRIEIAGERFTGAGLASAPEPAVDEPPAAGKYRLLTPASALRMNDSYANDPALARRAGAAEVHIGRSDALALGIANGARVRLVNENGAIEVRARIADLAPPGALLAYKGRWPKLEDGGVNLNVLVSGEKSDIGGSTTVHGTEVRVEPLE